MLDLILDVLGLALLFGQAAYFLLFADFPAGRGAFGRSVIPTTGRGLGDNSVI